MNDYSKVRSQVRPAGFLSGMTYRNEMLSRTDAQGKSCNCFIKKIFCLHALYYPLLNVDIYQPRSLVKQGDIALGSVRLSVCLTVSALMVKVKFLVRSGRY